MLGRLKRFVKPYDFVLAPILQTDELEPEERAEKPILITRFTNHSEEWADAIYYDVRIGKECRISVGERQDGCIPVKSYRATACLRTTASRSASDSRLSRADSHRRWRTLPRQALLYASKRCRLRPSP